jgi:hypothetical protein
MFFLKCVIVYVHRIDIISITRMYAFLQTIETERSQLVSQSIDRVLHCGIWLN